MRSYLRYGSLYGVVTAVLCAFYYYISFALGKNPLGGSKALSYFIMLVMFLILLWQFRKVEKGGILHFHQGFAVVMLEHIVSCVFFALFIWLSLNYFHPELLERHKIESKKFMYFIKEDLVKTIGTEGFEKGLTDLSSMSAASVAWDELKKRFLIMSFFVLVASFIMRRSPNWSVSR